jgi:hypothetical protein
MKLENPLLVKKEHATKPYPDAIQSMWLHTTVFIKIYFIFSSSSGLSGFPLAVRFLHRDFVYCHLYWLLYMGFGLVNGFIDHLYTWLRTTSIYCATTNLHNSQITTAPAKPFPFCCVLTSRSLAMASNSGDSSASCTQVVSSQASLQTLSVFKITPRHRLRRNTLFPTVPLLLHVDSLLWERVYWATAYLIWVGFSVMLLILGVICMCTARIFSKWV